MESEIEKIKRKEEFFKQIVHELKTEERFVNYFKQFDPSSVEGFITYYARNKVRWYELGEFYKRQKELKKQEWILGGFSALIQIQQKKLFNAQCLWRAEMIKLEGIEICRDFDYWQYNILWYQGIPHVEQHEIDFFIRYLRESSLENNFDRIFEMQSHYHIKNAFFKKEYPSYYNPWYQFYDLEFGTHSLFELPNIRKEKEEFYMNLHRQECQRISNEKTEATVNTPSRLKYFNERVNDFFENFLKENESKELYSYYAAYQRFHKLCNLNDEPVINIYKLKKLPSPNLPIVAADDWRTAVKMTWEKYRRDRVIEFLPEAYQIYLNHLGEKWDYPGNKENPFEDEKRLKRGYRKGIINGRILNGDPPDFNF